MKLPAVFVDGFDDCQLNFEKLGVALPFTAVAFGTATITVAASTLFSIPHGLSVTPQWSMTKLRNVSGYTWEGDPDSAHIYAASSVALTSNKVAWIAFA